MGSTPQPAVHETYSPFSYALVIPLLSTFAILRFSLTRRVLVERTSMPMNGYKPSSQTVFSPRQSLFFTASSPANGHVSSSRGPALRAASAGPSAVGPDGPGDMRESSPDTTVILPATPVDGERPRGGGGQDKAGLSASSTASSHPA